jgi:pseudolysin
MGCSFFDAVKAGGFGGNPKIGMITYDGSPNNKPVLDIRRDGATGTCYLQNDHAIVKDGRSVNYENDPNGKNASIMSFKCDQVDPTHGNIYWDGALDQVNGAWSPANDALYLADKVNSMYEDWYHIPVIHDPQNNNKPMMINMLVHDAQFKVDWSGFDWGGDNACWDPVNQVMRLGDGIELFGGEPMDDHYPFVVPDIIAHELSHGFSGQHAKFWALGMPGGINESFSDMASKAFEYYMTGQNTWMHGADMRKDNKATRYLDEPTKDCQEDKEHCSIDNAKNYTLGLDVHLSAGVFNKAFYLLSTSPAWNTRKAFNVMVQANRYHWTSSYLDFQEAACGVWDAANDLSYSRADLVIITNAMSQGGLEANETKCHPWSFSSIWSWISGSSPA